ncbi:MAG: molecular chaperone HtpG [Alphaproteobacteria bacterium]|nr:molecular chaperone HtpG [Alphaproteobacteria bacterium]
MSEEKIEFKTEVSKLLDIMINSLYSEKQIFLRELISNASDACDKLRYASITNPDMVKDNKEELGIWIIPNEKEKTLIIADNGIGMGHDDLIANLGTIARSGSAEFLSNIKKSDKDSAASLIGQFGVGFYSSFMVSNKVEVHTRKAGDDNGWVWISDGKGDFTIHEATKDDITEDFWRGTRITLHLNDDDKEYADPTRLRQIIRTYSDHIGIPVVLVTGEDGTEKETVNSASALWARPKHEITEEQYTEFYRHTAHAFDAPWMTTHYKAEGAFEYTGLLFIPSERPFDLFNPERHSQMKLYVNRVFIMEDTKNILLPPYLRFVRGVVDSTDLPLNVSREMLQEDPRLTKMQNGLVKRIITELGKKANDNPEEYKKFWDKFGAVIKEGIYEDLARREELAKICRFKSNLRDTPISLADYIKDMKDGQNEIFYITGSNASVLAKNPQLEGFTSKGVEVLLLTDPIDEFWPSMLGAFDGKSLKSISQAGIDLSFLGDEAKDLEEKDEKTDNKDIASLEEKLKEVLGKKIKDVKSSIRLTESPVCLVASEGAMSLHMQKLMRMNKNEDVATFETDRVLEINPNHSLIKYMSTNTDATDFSEMAELLLDQALIIEGEPVPDPVEFSRRITKFMEKGLTI